MKQKIKRKLAWLLVLGMIFSLFGSMPAMAQDPTSEITVTVGDVTVSAGESVKVPVSIANNPGIAGFDLKVNHSDNLELTGIEAGTVITDTDFASNSSVNDPYIGYAGLENMTGNGTMFYLVFTAGEKTGDETVSVEAGSAHSTGGIYDENADNVTIDSYAAGKVTVNEKGYTVTYNWGEDVPSDVALPSDTNEYKKNDALSADDTYTAESTSTAAKDGVPGTWKFSGWTADANLVDGKVQGNVTFTGTWTFTAATYSIEYVVAGDPTYGMPSDTVTPEKVTDIAYNSEVTLADDLTTTWTTSDGEADSTRGSWIFTGWSSTTGYADDLTKLTITDNSTVYGKWTFATDAAYIMNFVVAPDEVYGAPADAAEISDIPGLYAGEAITLPEDLTSAKTVAKGLLGTWSFTGWSTTDKYEDDITSYEMPESNVTIYGKWVFTPTDHQCKKIDAVEATCTTDGNTAYYKCLVCGKCFEDDTFEKEITEESTVIKSDGHKLTKTDNVPVSCTADGNIDYWTCSICGRLFADDQGTKELQKSETVVSAKGHALVHVEAKTATCTEAGNAEYWQCTACNKIFLDDKATKEAAESEVTYEKTAHNFNADGFCNNCSVYNPDAESYTIRTAENLKAISDAVNSGDNLNGKTVTLANDLTLAYIGSWTPIGGSVTKHDITLTSQEDLEEALEKYVVIYDNTGTSYVRGSKKNAKYDEARSYYYQNGGSFAGTFDGAGHTIDSLNVNSQAGYAGLFGNVSGTVKDLTVTGSVTTTTSQDFVGGIVGKLSAGGTISGCTSYVTVTAAKAFNVGGIVGFVGEMQQFVSESNPMATVENCANYGDVSGNARVGGIAGRNAGTVNACANHGTVFNGSGAKKGTGGIVGMNGVNNAAADAGIITNCYNEGYVNGNNGYWTGGITGFQNAKSSTENCYNAGAFYKAYSSSNPIIGQNEGTAKNCLWLTKESGDNTHSYIGTQADTGVYNSGGKAVDCKSVTEEELKAQTAVTTLNAGETTYFQEDCNDFPALVWESITAHTPVDGEAKEATCTEDGHTAGTMCSVCGAVIKAQEQIGAKGHTLVKTDAKASTCTEEGNITYWTCSVCGKFFADEDGKNEITETAVTKLAHEFNEDGFCNKCGVYNPEASAYTVRTAENLKAISDAVNGGDTLAGKTVTLANDITLIYSGVWTPIGGDVKKYDLALASQEDLNAALNEHFVIYDNAGASYVRGSEKNGKYDANRTYYYLDGGTFAGIFEGAGNTIRGMVVNQDAGYAGLFGNVSGTVKDLTVRGAVSTTTSKDFVGGIAGKLSAGGTISGCTSYVTVTAARAFNVGGIVGFIGEMGTFVSETNPMATVENCANYGDVSGNARVGGIAGRNAGTVNACANHGTVFNGSGAKKGTGGIVGMNGVNNAAADAGIITNCYNEGYVNGNNGYWTGGITGFQNAKSSTENCYNAGAFYKAYSSSNPIIGQNEGTAKNCLWLTKESGDNTHSYIGTQADTGVYNAGGKAADCTSVTEEELKLPNAVKTLNADAAVTNFREDCDDFPALFWENATAHTLNKVGEKKATSKENGNIEYWKCSVCGACFADEADETAIDEKDTITRKVSVSYSGHVQNIGWQDAVKDGEMAGTNGKSLRLEGLKVSLESTYTDEELSVSYAAHVENIGWQNEVTNGEIAGTVGENLQVEAVKLSLTGTKADEYSIYYRVHVKNVGWMSWTKDGIASGTAGLRIGLEAIEIIVLPKDDTSIDTSGTSFINSEDFHVSYASMVKGSFTDYVSDGEASGTIGEGLPLQGFKAEVMTPDHIAVGGGIKYSTHVSNLGWTNYQSDGNMSSYTGDGRTVEAIRLQLTGNIAGFFDVYYRVHSANMGWLGWVKNGAMAGTQGYGYQIESVEVVIVPKCSALHPELGTGYYKK